jgi:serine protease AprX
MTYRLGAPVVDALLLGPPNRRRQLQDFPILGDVWSALASRPGQPCDLLIVPARDKPTAEVVALISEENSSHDDRDMADGGRVGGAHVAYLHDLVVGSFELEHIYRVLIPATCWWNGIEAEQARGFGKGEAEPAPQSAAAWPDADTLKRWIMVELHKTFGRVRVLAELSADSKEYESLKTCDRAAAKLGVLLGLFRAAAQAPLPLGSGTAQPIPEYEVLQTLEQVAEKINFDTVAEVGAEALQAVMDSYRRYREPDTADWYGVVYQVALNREANPALTESVKAIKADAARTMFNICCSDIGWAVIDSGIDPRHKAFSDPNKGGKSRVRAAFDFRRVRAILGVRHHEIAALTKEIECYCKKKDVNGKDVDIPAILALIADDRTNGRAIDWHRLRKVIEIDLDDGGNVPENPHGTHVAGIIGANWPEKKLYGVCRDIRLYDFRVLGSDLGDSEFAVSAALQFIRFLNRQDGLVIHGANLSIAIRHNVRNYACGRTPVCIDAEALVSTGLVVVAAAGNRGYQQYQLADSTTFESYAASSITDPGNAEGVITVGSTHRVWPHTYGVSFFSSRGPTGDGRLKPDLLAPGEKIVSCIPNDRMDQMDGTSMAAPHVSGAAALMMARHRELQWDPVRIKQTLCREATDLNRERSFQGHGMVDVLRAIQAF